jgi:thiamine biosynthesis lipoprotein
MPPRSERIVQFECFGATVSMRASGDAEIVRLGLRRAKEIAEDVHRRLTRFEPDSDLCRLNADPRVLVPVAPLVRRFAEAVRWAGETSGGLVDATCLPAVEAAGYREHWTPGTAPAAPAAPATAPPATWRPAWDQVSVEGDAVRRPPGTRLDSGGIGKGLAADLMAAALAACTTWVVDCGGDLRIGGLDRAARAVDVADPDGSDTPIHRLTVARGAVATSGITRRSWNAGHHLVDPRTGRPADTGIIQVTAVARSGLQAEVRAKTALLAGPDEAPAILSAGGVYVTDDGTVNVVNSQQAANNCI